VSAHLPLFVPELLMMPLSLLRVTRFLLTLAVLVLPAVADAFSGTNGPGPEVQQVIRPIGVSSPDCSFTPYLEIADQEADISFSGGLGQFVSVGGGYFRFGSIVPTQSITAAMLESRCGMTNVTILVQDGPTGTFATDTYIGIRFRGTPDSQTQAYDYRIELVQPGVLLSIVNHRVAVNTPVNTPPTANAGSDQTAASGQTVTLSGAASSDPDTGQGLTYQWSQTGGPGVTLSGAATASPAFTAPVLAIGAAAAVLTFTLTVSDGTDSATDTVAVTVAAPANTAPTAQAGADQSAASGQTVTLSGAASSDPDTGQGLTYQWSQTDGPAVTLSEAATASPAFTAPVLAVGAANAVLTFTLTVSDGTASAVDTVAVTVTAPANTPPTALAGADQTAASGAAVTLDGSASSANDAEQGLSYQWSQTGGPGVALSGAATASPAFTAPVLAVGAADVVLTFTLAVSDGTANATDAVTVTVTAPANTPPTAQAGADQTVASGAAVTLDGSASSANDAGQGLTYQWSQTGGPAVTLSGTATASPAFTAPVLAIGSAAAALTFTLTVSDGTDSATDTVAVTVLADANTPPTADAGPDQTADSGGTVTLDGTASSANDPTQTLTFQWSQTAGPGVSLSGAATGRPTFIAPVLTAGEADLLLEFALAVSDGTDAATDLVSVRIRAPRAAVRPTVTLGNVPQSFGAGESFTVLVTFSAPVTGFTAGDMVVTGGAEVSVSGEGPVYTARIMPGQRESLTLQVPENAAVTLAGDGNTASAAVSIQYDTSNETEQLIADGLALRARQLIGSQPDLRSLFGPARGQFDAQVTQALGDFALTRRMEGPVWVSVQGSWAQDGDVDASYSNAALGGHLTLGETLLLGAMLQIDRNTAGSAPTDLEGTGWLLGPYIVVRSRTLPLTFSASALLGQSENDVSGIGSGSFSTDRSLLTAGFEGQVPRGNLTLIPSFDYARAEDRQRDYVDAAGFSISGQTVTVEEASLGLEVQQALVCDCSSLTLTGGIQAIFARIETPMQSEQSTRARIGLGLNYVMWDGGQISADVFLDGSGGSNSYQAHGVSLAYDWQF
jgi:hypothetical protein